MPSSACKKCALRSEEHTSELQSHDNLVCRLLLEKITIRSEEHTSELQSHDNLVCRLLIEKTKDNGGFAQVTNTLSAAAHGFRPRPARASRVVSHHAAWDSYQRERCLDGEAFFFLIAPGPPSSPSLPPPGPLRV